MAPWQNPKFKPKAKPKAKRNGVLQSKPVVSDVIKKYVKETIHKNIENKVTTFYENGQTLYNIDNDVASWRTNNFLYLSPRGSELLISQGVTQDTRIGNKIKIQKCTLRGIFYSNVDSLTPVDVMLYIFRPKIAYTTADVRTLVETDFFQDGSNSLALTGTLPDTVLMPNTDVYHLFKRKTFKIGLAQNQSNLKYVNNDYKYSQQFSMDVTKYLYKSYSFNDNDTDASEQPTVLMISPVPASNVLGGTGFDTVDVTWMIQLEYEDA